MMTVQGFHFILFFYRACVTIGLLSFGLLLESCWRIMNEDKKIILHSENVENRPECPHGPTLMFSRGIGARRFYACSAYRDRKFCDFFLWEDDKITAGKKLAWSVARDTILPKLNFKELQASKEEVVNVSPKRRAYCRSCNCLFLTNKHETKHRHHDVVTNVSDHLLAHPSQLIKLKENAKKESQFLFSTATINCIVSGISDLKIDHLICIGTPTLKENCKIPSILLDIDHRYATFYDSSDFLWFNMSNSYFFSDDGAENLKKKVCSSKCAIILDPPFGALLEPIKTTLQKIVAECDLLDPPILLILPYFMEKQVLNHFPNFIMLDYEVSYVNHDKFSANGRKQGSPIRIFTNFKKFPLPASEGYRFCNLCERWASVKNAHCYKCNECTSKNGSTYKHCYVCRKCTKPSWAHCDTCQKCTQMKHKCLSTENPFKQKRESDGENKHQKLKKMKTSHKSN